MPLRRGTLLLVVGVGVPVLLLALGWWTTSSRESAAKEREARALLVRSADVVRGVVDASLEELRAREDARPFDAYNYVYNPPGVVSLTDALALSPLARDPEDKRVVGYFQIDRVDGRTIVKTPYERDPLARASERARNVASHVEAPGFSELVALATAAPTETQVASATNLGRKRSTASSDKLVGRGGYGGNKNEVVEQKQEAQSIAALNTLQNKVYSDLQEAESSVSKRSALSQQKVLPQTARKNVAWEDPLPSKSKKKPTSKGDKEALFSKSASQQELPDTANAAPSLVEQKASPPDAQPVAAEPGQPTIEYAPMVFDRFGDDLVLYRLVSAGKSRSVQGVLLDKAQILSGYIPAVIERHVIAAVRPRVVDASFSGPCSLRAAASDLLDDLDLCFPEDALATLDDGTRGIEGTLLALLLVVVAAAVWATDRAARRADELSRQKGAFISAISHELRTPLTTLRMHAELLRDNLVGPERRGKFHDDMVRESVRLSHLVENVLEATRLEEGRRPLRAQRADLGAAVRECCDAQAAFVAAKGFTLDVDAAAVELSFDRQALEQILVNLLDNAAKYAADASDKTLRVQVTDEGARACLRVMDRGPGVPVELREKVFQRFFRVERPGHDHVVGTGLGLALVRELAHAHGGTAIIEDRDGGGCCVAVRLPNTA